PGVVGDGFSFTGADQAVDVGPSANLRLQNFTIEAWIQRYSSTVVSVDTDPNYDGDGVLFGFGLGGYAFILYHDSTLLLSQEGVGGVFSSETITDTSFHHVAVTEDSGTVTFYIDGQVAGVSDNYGPTFSFDTDAFIGAIPTSAGASFYGNIDEMAIYNRPLGSDEIQAIYGAGSAGKCSALTIVDQPTNEVGIVGGTNVFYIQAFGSPPITYKWQFDGAAILNATNPLFVITNVQPTNAGTYS